MARPLKKQGKSSSVASLLTKLDPEIGRAATERVETRSTEQNADKNQGLKKPDKIAGHIGRGEDQRNTSAEQSLSTGEMAEVKKQFLLTETTLGYLDGTLEVFKSATGAKISQSLFLRSIIKAIHEC